MPMMPTYLKKCSCGEELTTDNTDYQGAVLMGNHEWLVWFNCQRCHSTAVLRKSREEAIAIIPEGESLD